MRFSIMLCVLAVTGCGPAEETATEPVPEQAAAPEPIEAAPPPPRREEFTEAWAEACPGAEPADKGLCKSKGFGDPDFTCDFALGDGKYRRYTAELTQADGQWVLADPDKACALAD